MTPPVENVYFCTN